MKNNLFDQTLGLYADPNNNSVTSCNISVFSKSILGDENDDIMAKKSDLFDQSINVTIAPELDEPTQIQPIGRSKSGLRTHRDRSNTNMGDRNSKLRKIGSSEQLSVLSTKNVHTIKGNLNNTLASYGRGRKMERTMIN